jgi:hypothetical protein
MHPFSILTFSIFVAGYATARWDLVNRVYALAVFAWDHGVVSRAAQGFAVLSILFLLVVLPVERLASHEVGLVCRESPSQRKCLPPPASPDSRRRHFCSRAAQAARILLTRGGPLC